jgi:Flp pilus assembly protein TadD
MVQQRCRFSLTPGRRSEYARFSLDSSAQQVLDCGFQLLGIVRPVTVDFQAVGPDGPAVCGTPLMQRLMRGNKLRIGSVVDDDRGLTDWRRHAGDLALANEISHHLDAKIDRHDGRTLVMIEKDVMAVGSQSGVLAKESPYAVEGRSREALTFFTRHLDMVKDDQQTLVQMGKCYSDLNELDQAETTLRRALALGDDAVGYYNLGFVMEQRRRESEAEQLYLKALAVDPNHISSHNNLAGILAGKGNFTEALNHLNTVVRLSPGSADGYNNLGALYLQIGRPERAASYLQQAIDLNPNDANSHANMGTALASRGLFDEALAQFDEALRLDPKHRDALANRAAVAARVRPR